MEIKFIHGKKIIIIARGKGRVERLCSNACCKNKPRDARYILLPCGCHSTLVACTCRLHDRHCNKCHATFLGTSGAWMQIEDPHRKRDISCGHPACEMNHVSHCDHCDTPFCEEHGRVGGDRQVQEVGAVAYPSECWKCGGTE